MRFEESQYFNNLKPYKLEMPFGNFYFCEKFFISELNEGVHFEWKMIKLVMNELIKFYGEDIKLGYISNRINSYSTDPQTWDKVDKNYGIITAGAIVAYNDMVYLNATLEKRFFNKSIKRCSNLHEAVEWISNIIEFH